MKFLAYPFLSAGGQLKAHLTVRRHALARGWLTIAKIVGHRMQRKFGVFIAVNASVPGSTRFPHPTSIVIGDGVILGENVTIYQGVTLGGARLGDFQDRNYPTIGDDVVIFAGAVVAGNIVIGRQSVIGANSVVLADIPEGATAVGAPARVARISTLSA